MKENTKAISIINILKILVIIVIAIILLVVAILGIKNKVKEKQEEKSQIVAEIVYTDDVKEKTELEKFGEKFNVKLSNEKNRFLVTAIAFSLFIVELILLVFALDFTSKLLVDYKNKYLKGLSFIMCFKVLLLLLVNLILYLSLKATSFSIITIIETILVIIMTIICYILVKRKNK